VLLNNVLLINTFTITMKIKRTNKMHTFYINDLI